MTPEQQVIVDLQQVIVDLQKLVIHLNARVDVMNILQHTMILDIRQSSPEIADRILAVTNQHLEAWLNMEGTGGSAPDAVAQFRSTYPVPKSGKPPRFVPTLIDGGKAQD